MAIHSASSAVAGDTVWDLCQTGAARMACDGARFDEILAFYYPHTNLTKIYD